jgi:glucose-6-phosphate 1-dehydrogenase
MPKQFRIVKWHTALYDEQFRAHLEEGMKEFASYKYSEKEWHDFASNLSYQQGRYTDLADFKKLGNFLKDWEKDAGNRIYYMATPPGVFPNIIDLLGLTDQLHERNGWRRVVIEKPFGTDLESARSLNEQIHKALNERQIYRIDHYLGKETVQNILVSRFANTIFEPLWNRNYIDHVEITVAEQVGVEHRARFYDQVGVLRDMFQNHLLQLVSLVAMEPPVSFDATALRNEKVKVLSAIHPMREEDVPRRTVRAQYKGYRAEEGVDKQSMTPTYAAVRLQIDNWRWQGVPFYLRTGKCLKVKLSQVPIEFNEPPHLLFPNSESHMKPNSVLISSLMKDAPVPRKEPDTVSDAFCGYGITMPILGRQSALKPMSVSCWIRSQAMRPCSPARTKWKLPGGSSIRLSARGRILQASSRSPFINLVHGGQRRRISCWRKKTASGLPGMGEKNKKTPTLTVRCWRSNDYGVHSDQILIRPVRSHLER